MSFPRYEENVESGVDWVGNMPTHWSLIALKRIASLRSGEAITSEQIAEEGRFPVFGGNGLRGYCDSYTHDGDFVLIGRQGALCGNVNYASGRFWASEHALVATPLGRFVVRWLGELLLTMNLNQYSVSAAQPGLSVESIGKLVVPIPPLDEQGHIASFLYRETAKIDALVEEQQRLVALLKEKRQAVISHAVTKGLDPNVPTKHSGVEWLGEVPAHWDISRLKRATVLLKDGTHLPPPRVSDGIPLLSVRNIESGRFGLRDDDSLISEADYAELSRAFVPMPNDVLLAIVGATLGKVALIPAGLGRFHIQRSVAILRSSPAVRPEWLRNAIASDGFQRLLWEHVGYSAQPGIYLGSLADFCIPVPPNEEQREIAAFLTAETSKIDNLTAEAESAITLLQERRSALISAAVTGKIDVRNLVPVEAEAA